MAESYTVLALKYRPRRFADLVGQPHIVGALSNAIATNRVAHAFLLTGSRGTGKTTTARILASALNCPNRQGAEPCGECPSCVQIAQGEDLDVIEMDAASNSRVDDIRERLQTVETRPARGRYRVFIIDEVHMLSTSAFNALLKTVEEPPPHVKFILATTNPEKIPETILSRCQRYDFRRVTVSEIVTRLEQVCANEGAEPGPGLLRAVAELVEGGLRDALSRLDQLFAFCGLKPTVEDAERVFGLVSRPRLLELLEALGKGDSKSGILFTEEVFESGKDVAEVLASLVSLTRSLLLVAASGGDAKGLDVPADEVPRLTAVAQTFGIHGLVYVAELLTDCRNRVRRAAFPRVVVETTLVKLSLVGRLEPLQELMTRLNHAADSSEPRTESPPPATEPGKRPLSEREQAAVNALKRQFGAR
ncbi:MAG: DNA polymerase III subunit gamma/tau [Planctomycetes bacterium]|nr:DNA polymerase III subunit gamma/tau [Planctomycetota bacterium]MCW8136202.1 DNA polymerase III subunit gamma/tau [Planctomycetota bacterium]